MSLRERAACRAMGCSKEGDVTRCQKTDKKSENTCARGAASVTAGGQCIVALPDIAHELGVATDCNTCSCAFKRRTTRDKRIRGRRTLA